MKKTAAYLTEKPWRIFAALWLLLFVLYFPAAQSGMVGDSVEWLNSIRHDSFWDYLNRTRYHSAHSFYQFTLLMNWLCYQLWGTNAWMWHLLFLTLHALNGYLLYLFTSRLFRDANLTSGNVLALAAVSLYAFSPYHVEAIVWDASYHYLQAFLIILCILLLAQRYLHQPRMSLALGAAALYLPSIFSLELFYLTPAMVCTLALFYRKGLNFDVRITRRLILFFCVPQVLMLLLQLLLFGAVYGTQVPHVGHYMKGVNLGYLATRPPEYLFHLLWGRFLPDALRNAVHRLVTHYLFAALFYGGLAAVTLFIMSRFRRMDAKGKLTSLFFVWMILAVSLLLPLWFPNILLSVSDRYMYVLIAFYFIAVVLLISLLKNTALKAIIWMAAMMLNIGLTLMMTNYWGISRKIIKALETNVPLQQNKTVLLLNCPASYKGIAMIGCTWEGEFKLVNTLLYGNQIPNRMTEVLGYNMATPDDGAQVTVLNDSMVQVTLQHRDINFWFGGTDGVHLETPFYKITAQDTGLWYRLVLKNAPSKYQLLYQTGMHLKTVDMSLKDIAQH